MARLFLIRHGQASFLADDYDRLSLLGQTQARRLGQHLASAGLVPDRVLVGPLRRQRHTAELAAAPGWPPPTELPELTEHEGDRLLREHLPAVLASSADLAALADHAARAGSADERSARVARLLDRVLRLWASGGFDPLVEPFAAFRQRAARALDLATADGRLVLAFTSGGLIGAMLAEVLRCPDETAIELGLGVVNTSLCELLFTSGRRSLRAFNVTPHLDPGTVSFR